MCIRDSSNVILGATIETNRDGMYVEHGISRAPLPSIRLRVMKEIEWDKKFISIEPILDFDFDEFASHLKEISPIMIYIGYDNYNHKLPEPPLPKVLNLINELSKYPILIIRKTIRPAWFESLMKFIKE